MATTAKAASILSDGNEAARSRYGWQRRIQYSWASKSGRSFVNRARSAIAALSGTGALCCALPGEDVPLINLVNTKTLTTPAMIFRSGEAFLTENIACILGVGYPLEYAFFGLREAQAVG